MAAINDLINQISDAELRDRIQSEVNKLSKQKKFGLVFEEHLPECTPLYDMPVKAGCKVMLRDRSVDKSIYVVGNVDDGQAICVKQDGSDPITFALADIVRIAEFGEAIYPYLKPLDSVCNAPDSDLWHTLIEADNYHALQLLEYLYAGQVDCIYIDPPYNTGARDWKYNNDYVDSNDAYRHSKWLSMMEKRLKLAKKLLNPKDSVMIVTVDEKEYLHLGCLLEELFAGSRIQMVSIVIQAAGQNRKGELGRVEEYAYFVFNGNFEPCQSTDDLLNDAPSTKPESVRWESLLRGGTGSLRKDSPNLFYPIFLSESGRIVGCGESKPVSASLDEWTIPAGTTAIWPYKTGNIQGRWRATQETLMALVNDGWAKAGKITGEGKGSVWYVGKSGRKKVETGEFVITGIDEQGAKVIDVVSASEKTFPIKTVWNRARHHAGWYGTNMLSGILPERRFPFPKSLYAVQDTLRIAVANKPNALVIDFFAGSGTTLHAVNLLNAEDGGHRRCIMVTNNEVSDDEAKNLAKQGYHPGDEEWNKLGIARYVTWPRTVCSIEGHDVNGNTLKGNYLGEYNDKELPMADGFKTNAAFFQLGFLDKTAVELGMQFKEMIPTLWMKAGSIGPCPQIDNADIDMLILPQNKFAVLLNEGAFPSFKKQLLANPEIQTVYLVTDYDVNYRSMANDLPVKKTYQLYRDYLDNFRINHGRN